MYAEPGRLRRLRGSLLREGPIGDCRLCTAVPRVHAGRRRDRRSRRRELRGGSPGPWPMIPISRGPPTGSPVAANGGRQEGRRRRRSAATDRRRSGRPRSSGHDTPRKPCWQCIVRARKHWCAAARPSEATRRRRQRPTAVLTKQDPETRLEAQLAYARRAGHSGLAAEESHDLADVFIGHRIEGVGRHQQRRRPVPAHAVAEEAHELAVGIGRQNLRETRRGNAMDARLDHRQALSGLAVTSLIAADDRRLPARLDVVTGWRQPESGVDLRRVTPSQDPLGTCVDDPQGHARPRPRARATRGRPTWRETPSFDGGIDAEAVMRVKGRSRPMAAPDATVAQPPGQP